MLKMANLNVYSPGNSSSCSSTGSSSGRSSSCNSPLTRRNSEAAKAAKWLERASNVLTNKRPSSIIGLRHTRNVQPRRESDNVQNELRKLEKLINEAPTIGKVNDDNDDSLGQHHHPEDQTISLARKRKRTSDKQEQKSAAELGLQTPSLQSPRNTSLNSRGGSGHDNSYFPAESIKNQTGALMCTEKGSDQPDRRHHAGMLLDQEEDEIISDQFIKFFFSNKPLRRGKWTIEEEEYVTRIIRDFNEGYLEAKTGTTLRSYLSSKLHCDPMRITKKFTGAACIGKRIYHPVKASTKAEEPNDLIVKVAQDELNKLRRAWIKRLYQQEQEAAAVALAKNECLSGRLSNNCTEGLVVTLANWIDRADKVLSPNEITIGTKITKATTILNEIQQLILESSSIQDVCTRLPQLVANNDANIANSAKY